MFATAFQLRLLELSVLESSILERKLAYAYALGYSGHRMIGGHCFSVTATGFFKEDTSGSLRG